ncbi:serine/threonine protein kinase [Gracilibacillus orientalis]|uniref:Serine/threonine protein kinase n=1 Tax=Gracilibacillus orientalis TaxID=334253 RepID=A0A1I4HA63_9BACI|nr:PASTA domain-containing protein [Gracilibacillus orientalis]SFL38311.1 serine/threonine protein kinase [Gracilibacillus orientalis]
MSDFLSNFNKDNYDKQPKDEKESVTSNQTSSQEQPPKESFSPEPKSEKKVPSDSNEHIEIDPNYQRKKRKKLIIYIALSIVALLLIVFLYYSIRYVDMENFVGEPVADARTWANENNMEIELLQEHSMEYDANQIMEQDIEQGKNVKKGSTINLTSSIGPDPEEPIELPDFSELTASEAEVWKNENKAENLQIVTEFSDEVEEGQFTRFVMSDEEISKEEYKRQDNANVYFSKGEEVFEEDIEVPDFVNKNKEEVEQWAETNEIEISYKEEAANDIEAGLVSKQNIDPESMIAKNDEMEITMSLGKAVEVPNFASFSMEEAASYEGLTVTVRQRFHNNVKYGNMIAQSIEPGTELTDQDNKSITITYSEGEPYLRDYRGQLEGDLPRLFYEDYQSKGADISYIVKYVDASEVKGTVVGMSNFNSFVSMDYTVEIHVSNNEDADPGSFDTPEGNEAPEEIEEELSPETEGPEEEQIEK